MAEAANCEKKKQSINRDGNNKKISNRKRKTYSNNKQKQKEMFMNEDDYRLRLQEVLYSSDYILSRIFRKDGPPLGVEFDSLPSNAFLQTSKGCKKLRCACPDNDGASKRRKVSLPPAENNAPAKKHGIGKGLMNGALVKKHGMGKGLMIEGRFPAPKHGVGKGFMVDMRHPVKKHGMGKGLMTVWRATHGDGVLPITADFGDTNFDQVSDLASQELPAQKRRKKMQRRQPLMQKLKNKAQAKRKPSTRKLQVESQSIAKQKCPRKEKCDIPLEGLRCPEDLDRFATLIDDEELELRDLQAGANPLTCSAHCGINGMYGCSLCKDLLAEFPPSSVTMKLPLHMQPWDSSPEIVKKLFKVFHFLCTYASKIDISSFTFDELAQAFIDKDSVLLGQIHVALLKVLLSDLELETRSGSICHISKNCKFLGLLHSVEQQEFVLEFWQKSLNPLTWTEILRQVLVSAGFGTKRGASTSEGLNKEDNLLVKYGLNPGTVKAELFSTLLMQGNNGMRVSELAKALPIAELNLGADVEAQISSILSSDITLFEKISSCGYRLRVSPASENSEICPSESEDFGSVDDDSNVSSCEVSDCESGDLSPNRLKTKNLSRKKDNILTLFTEIDESHPGEPWLLGMMEGEYSDLSCEEKLNALTALIDLLVAGTSIRMEDVVVPMTKSAAKINHYGSGAKIKRSTVKQYSLPGPLEDCSMPMLSQKDTASAPQPVDSLILSSGAREAKMSYGTNKDKKDIEKDLHPMQSVFLGSDRRYNRYWLFLGPCNDIDPGHRRIYFESSEDGHWEVIDNQEALCSLLSALDCRGTREAHLLASLEKLEGSLCQTMSSVLNESRNRQLTLSDQSNQNVSREDSSSAVSDVDNNLWLNDQNDFASSTGPIVAESGKNDEQQREKWNRTQAFDSWIWKLFYSELNAVKYGRRSYLDSLTRCERCHDLYWRDEKHCRICHTTFELDFDLEERYAIHVATCQANISTDKVPKHKVLSSQLQSLKAAIYAIESVMPEDALLGSWTKFTHNLWIKRLRRVSTLREFLQVLADFVSAIKEDWLYQLNDALGPNCVQQEILASFPTMPQTSSAVALWLIKLDSLIAPHLERLCSQNQLK